jgi:uncharacterized membrane protein
MAYYLKLYLATLIIFLTVDLVWLGLVARPFYEQQLGVLLVPTPNWVVALAFYLLFNVGLLVFVVGPSLPTNSLTPTLLRAALFGLVTYATYDLTNLATLKDWPLLITVVDMLWGTSLSVIVSLVSFRVGQWLR